MAKVLKADCSTADAYAREDLSGLGSNLYVGFEVLIPQATMTALDAASKSFGAENMEIAVGFDGFFTKAPFTTSCHYWTDHTPHGPFSGLTADAWHLVRYAYVAHAVTWQLDGSTFDTYTAAATPSTEFFEFGGRFAAHVAGEIYYIRNVKIGTTPGGTDLFSDDFASGDLSHWTSSSGAVSVVDDPFSGARFTLNASPSSDTIPAGGSASIHVTATLLSGPDDTAHLTATTPAGLTAAFAPTSIDEDGGSALCTITVDASTAAGTYTVTIHGTDSDETVDVPVTVTVPAVVPAFALHGHFKAAR